ncbi:hypothetical protein [Roseateles flavus]|uniref:Uncharacterized protein n=1 Tax=Roseateles flavus TaxID=3149041 RepID=A0ABV0GLM9_9BURK
MKLRQICLPAEAFLKIPDAERALLVALGHALNEFNIFNRLLIASSHFDDEPVQVAYAQSIQMYSITRVLVGKILEAWNAIDVGFFRSKLSKKYVSRLNDDQAQSLDRLKKYFSKRNAIADIRNGLAFHFSIESAGTAPKEEMNEHDLSLYIGESRGNCLYPFSETIFNTELMRITNCATMREAFAKVIDEVNAVDKPLHEFAEGVMALILEDYIGGAVLKQFSTTVEIGISGSLGVKLQ